MSLIQFIAFFCLLLAEAHGKKFSNEFRFGAATASYQIEGGWNLDGKGENIWDFSLHKHPEKVLDGSNGDIACDSYHQWQEDIKMLKFLGVDFYRFSLAWARILPTGKLDQINQAGIDYYNNLIDGLLSEGIEPYISLYHWELPQALQEAGGFSNRSLIDHYVNYANVAFQNFGDRVKIWFTFNEPYRFCEYGYGVGKLAPFVENFGVGGYQCGHTVLLAHAKTYSLYQEKFKNDQKGQVGLIADSEWYEPKNPDSSSDIQASILTLEMALGWFYNPLVYGNYPQKMIDRIKEQSLKENLEESRLPEFTLEEQKLLKGSFDFLGLNHYSTHLVEFGNVGLVSFEKDLGVTQSSDPSWTPFASPGLYIVPIGLRKLLVWIKERYDNPKLLITENGYSDDGNLQDNKRISYLTGYLEELWKAIYQDGCNVVGYTHWSLMDNFEWIAGYKIHFGLFQVDFSDDQRNRTPKKSSKVYKEIISSRRLPSPAPSNV